MIADLLADALRRSFERTLTVMELLNVAGTLQGAGESSAVSMLYKTWLEHNADNPIVYAIQFNHAVILSNTGDLEGAKHALSEAIRINPDFYPAYINYGHVLERLGLNGDGVSQWYTVSNRLAAVSGDNVNYKLSALKQIGRLLEKSNFDAHAEDALRLSLEINANQSDVIQHWVSLRQRQCKWPIIKPWNNVTRKQLLDGISTLSLDAYTDDPLLQLANAHIYARDDVGQPKSAFHAGHAKIRAEAHPTRRKIGYVSSDLREHAVGFLTSEIYGLHDREKVEVFVYYCGIAANDAIHKRVKETSDHWFDFGGMGDEQAAQKVAADGVEILIDLNGYTNGARTKVFAMSPAPINVNWLGYPGTLGSPYFHYIIADDYIIPPDAEKYYSERVMRIPCYQPNDRGRQIAPGAPTRAEHGLPEEGTVFCCFNGVHKITQFTWARWMYISVTPVPEESAPPLQPEPIGRPLPAPREAPPAPPERDPDDNEPEASEPVVVDNDLMPVSAVQCFKACDVPARDCERSCKSPACNVAATCFRAEAECDLGCYRKTVDRFANKPPTPCAATCAQLDHRCRTRTCGGSAICAKERCEPVRKDCARSCGSAHD